MTLNINMGFAGRYKLEAFQQDEAGEEIPGTRRVAADWFPNLITNAGLDYLGATGVASVWTYIRVGSGSTAPANTDTALVSQVAVSSTAGTNNGVNQQVVGPPFYGYYRRVVRFAAGAATGNISEVGCSPTTSGSLFSRALVLDGLGSPTTVTVLASEALDVTYELRIYPQTSDATSTVTIASVNYTWTARALRQYVGVGAWAEPGKAAFGFPTGESSSSVKPGTVATLPSTTTTSFGTITNIGAITAATYTNGNYYRDFTLPCGLSEGNTPGGIGAFVAQGGQTGNADGRMGSWGFGLSPVLPKTASYTCSLTVRFTWGRATI